MCLYVFSDVLGFPVVGRVLIKKLLWTISMVSLVCEFRNFSRTSVLRVYFILIDCRRYTHNWLRRENTIAAKSARLTRTGNMRP